MQVPVEPLSVAGEVNLDLTQTPLQIVGRSTTGALPTLAGMEQLSVQVDVPLYTADDVYSTRWRTAGANGANPNPVSAGGSQFNPFPGTTLLGQTGRTLFDRAERFSRPAGQGSINPQLY